MMNTVLEMWTSQWSHELQGHTVTGCAVNMVHPRASAGSPEITWVDFVLVSTVFPIVSLYSLPAAEVRPN